MPPLNSKTRRAGVYIEGAEIDDSLPGGTLVLTVRNDTDRAVASFQVQIEDEVEGTHGLIEPGQAPAIEPHGTARLRVPLDNLASLDSEVALNAVVFADGTEAGDSKALDFIKKMRRHVKEANDKERRAAREKEVPQ